MKEVVVEISPLVYSLQAIKNTGYDFSGEAWIDIRLGETNINVVMRPKENSAIDITELKQKFLNSLLDHQVRIDTAKEFKTIREMIVAQAFEPCDNLDEVVEHMINDPSKKI